MIDIPIKFCKRSIIRLSDEIAGSAVDLKVFWGLITLANCDECLVINPEPSSSNCLPDSSSRPGEKYISKNLERAIASEFT